MSNNDLKIIVMDSMKDFGNLLNENLNKLNGSKEDHLINLTASRFQNGEGKVKLNETVRGKNVFILTDVGNYSVSYMLHGKEHFMAPDEHFQDIKRVIGAIAGHANKVTVIMPFLYQSRQHRKKGRESLDCAMALQELERLGIDDIVTFDAHDPNICNAIPTLPFENFYPTHTILSSIIENEIESIDNLLVISPDTGAMERARYYADMLGCNVGLFYKRRDYSRVVNGKNPIVCHAYMGDDVEGKNIIVVDDMISSGNSMIEVCEELKKKGAKNIFLVATFALFTEGTDNFKEAYKKNLFSKIYSTNLSYVPEETKKEKWFYSVDCSMQLANVVNTLNNNISIAHLFNGKEEIALKIKKYLEENSNK